MSYAQELAELQRVTGRPVRIALVGAGQMGRGFVSQVSRIGGMEVVAIADVDVDRALGAFHATGAPGAVSADDVDTAARLIDSGKQVALGSADLVPGLPVDVVVEATGVPEVGAKVLLANLLAGHDVATLNVETDVTVGLILRRIAEQAGLIYTVCRGDEPAEAKILTDYARDLGFEVVCAGKGKNNPLDVFATPDRLAAEAASKGMNPKMLCSFVDGSKAMIEMAALANTTGLRVSTRGMHGPASSIKTLQETFALKTDGGVLDSPGVVDYCTGDVAPGVFVVARTDEPYVLEEMHYLKMGKGPYYSFYRPYHLASVEAPLSVMELVIDRKATLVAEHWTAEVAARAKRDLMPGDRIDGIGGSTVAGLIDNAEDFRRDNLVPLGVLQNATVTRTVKAGEPLTYADVALDETQTILALRRLQDTFLASGLWTTPPQVPIYAL
jgi:predicted homoserine dehydrogenase-like protein